MFDRLFRFFSSLRLTVVLLAFGIVLVFVGTVAQADEGLYNAQARYFKHWFVRGITMFGHRIPIGLPGGYLMARCCSSTSSPPTSSVFNSQRRNRHPAHARGRHRAARRPAYDRPLFARDANPLFRGSNQVLRRERDELRTGLHHRPRTRTPRKWSRFPPGSSRRAAS